MKAHTSERNVVTIFLALEDANKLSAFLVELTFWIKSEWPLEDANTPSFRGVDYSWVHRFVAEEVMQITRECKWLVRDVYLGCVNPDLRWFTPAYDYVRRAKKALALVKESLGAILGQFERLGLEEFAYRVKPGTVRKMKASQIREWLDGFSRSERRLSRVFVHETFEDPLKGLCAGKDKLTPQSIHEVVSSNLSLE